MIFYPFRGGEPRHGIRRTGRKKKKKPRSTERRQRVSTQDSQKYWEKTGKTILWEKKPKKGEIDPKVSHGLVADAA